MVNTVFNSLAYYHLHTEDKERNAVGFIHGSLGLSLCYYLAWKYSGKDDYKAAFITSIQKANYNVNIDLSEYSSVLWLNSFCDRTVLGNQIILNNCRKILLQLFRNDIQKKNYGYFNGAIGVLLPLLDDTDDTSEPLSRLFSSFVAQSLDNKEFSSNIIIDKKSVRTTFVGVPHGVTGILLCLLKLKQKGLIDDDILIRHVADYLLNCAERYEGNLHFPHRVSSEYPDKEKYYKWVCWSFGDLMPGYALLKAGILLNDNDLSDIGNNILYSIFGRDGYNHYDISLCCGISAMPSIYRSSYILTNDNNYKNASNEWMDRLSDVVSDSNVGSKIRGYNSPSLFYGLPGALLAIFDNDLHTEYTDRFLLL